MARVALCHVHVVRHRRSRCLTSAGMSYSMYLMRAEPAPNSSQSVAPKYYNTSYEAQPQHIDKSSRRPERSEQDRGRNQQAPGHGVRGSCSGITYAQTLAVSQPSHSFMVPLNWRCRVLCYETTHTTGFADESYLVLAMWLISTTPHSWCLWLSSRLQLLLPQA